MSVPSHFANRITRYAEVDPGTLAANPKNWRRHPSHQAQALAGVLSSVGYVQSVIVNERSGNIVDGHLRVELAVDRAEPFVPVAFVDLTDDEEALILATFDPLGALAETNRDALATLLGGLAERNDGLGEMLAGLAASVTTADVVPPEVFPEYGDDIETHYECPSCHYEWSGKPRPDAS